MPPRETSVRRTVASLHRRNADSKGSRRFNVAVAAASQIDFLVSSWQPAYRYPMSWDANDAAQKLWAGDHSAGQIASRLGYSRSAVSANVSNSIHLVGAQYPKQSW